jgi:hypothetical protein
MLINLPRPYKYQLKAMSNHCCEQMNKQVSLACHQHADRFECPDALIDYSPKFDEYGLIIHDGGSGSVVIEYCPWCGTKLPGSKRDRWFDELERMGIDDPTDEQIPERYKSEAWYRF